MTEVFRRKNTAPHELHGLIVLDAVTVEWLLNTCTEI